MENSAKILFSYEIGFFYGKKKLILYEDDPLFQVILDKEFKEEAVDLIIKQGYTVPRL